VSVGAEVAALNEDDIPVLCVVEALGGWDVQVPKIVPFLAVPQSERRHIRDAAAGKIDVVRVTIAPHNAFILAAYCSNA
jgi:hypothetical protein